jgi:hypothetical protein
MSDAQLVAFLNDPRIMTILLLLTIWDLVWRGIALWKASRNNSMPWFIALLVLNTVGILPIIYIFFFSKKKKKK